MNIETIGPWIALLLGAAVLLPAAYAVLFRGQQNLYASFLAVLGGLLVGVSVWGLAFIQPYTDFVKTIFPTLDNPSSETYENLYAKIGTGEIKDRPAELALAYTLDRPVEQMDKLLDKAITQATDRRGREALVATRKELEGKQQVARQLADSPAVRTNTMATLDKLDTATRTLVSREILARPPARLAPMPRVNTNELRRFIAPRDLRVRPR